MSNLSEREVPLELEQLRNTDFAHYSSEVSKKRFNRASDGHYVLVLPDDPAYESAQFGQQTLTYIGPGVVRFHKITVLFARVEKLLEEHYS